MITLINRLQKQQTSNSLEKRLRDYTEVDELLKSNLTYQAIAEQVGYSLGTIWRRAKQLQAENSIPLRQRGRPKKDYTEVDELLKSNLTYPAIAEQVGYSLDTIWRRAKQLQAENSIPLRQKRKPINPELIIRNSTIISDALTTDYSLTQLGQKYNLTRERIRQILLKEDGNLKKLKKIRIYDQLEEETTLASAKKSLVDIIAQNCFDRIIHEKGLEYALAWRLKKDWKGIKAKGTKYTEDELAALIRARLETNPKNGKPTGYSLALINAGWVPDHKTAKNIIPIARILLESALHDIDYAKPKINFGERKYFTTQEEIETFKKLIEEGESMKGISEYLGIPIASIHYHKRKLNL